MPVDRVEERDDPLRAQAMRGIRFRPSDTPEVREALIEAAMKREMAFTRDALERRGVSDARS